MVLVAVMEYPAGQAAATVHPSKAVVANKKGRERGGEISSRKTKATIFRANNVRINVTSSINILKIHHSMIMTFTKGKRKDLAKSLINEDF